MILATLLLWAQPLYLKNSNNKITLERKSDSDDYMTHFCKHFNRSIQKYKWKQIVCKKDSWTYDPQYITPGNFPLVYRIVDFPPIQTTTLVMCTIHSDEYPSPFICVHLLRDLLFDNPTKYKNARVIIAPMINPDSFFSSAPRRTNFNGIDLNRNFPTKDFSKVALQVWKDKYKEDPRKFPGEKASSEIETKFQIMLIDKFKPDKIISVHSPYGWLDFDLPQEDVGDEGSGVNLDNLLKDSNKIVQEMSKKSYNYPIKKFNTFPGSLGKYAALERLIPTYTLELPTSNSKEAYNYWKRVHQGIVAAINYRITSLDSIKKDRKDGLKKEDQKADKEK